MSPLTDQRDTCPKIPTTGTNIIVVGSSSPKRVPGSASKALQVISITPKPIVARGDDPFTHPNAEANEHKATSLPGHSTVEPVSTVIKAKESIRSILDMVELSGMSLAEMAALEDEMFEAFSKLRKRRQSMG